MPTAQDSRLTTHITPPEKQCRQEVSRSLNVNGGSDRVIARTANRLQAGPLHMNRGSDRATTRTANRLQTGPIHMNRGSNRPTTRTADRLQAGLTNMNRGSDRAAARTAKRRQAGTNCIPSGRLKACSALDTWQSARRKGRQGERQPQGNEAGAKNASL